MDTSDKEEILAAINALASKVATKDDLARVEVDLKAEIAQTRHEASAAHFRTGGRIDQVAGMLAEHMASGHKPAA